MLSLFRPQKSKGRGTLRELKPRKLQFDILEDRTLLSVTIKGLPIDLGTIAGYTEVIPRAISDSGRVMGQLSNGPQSQSKHAFVYDVNSTIRDIGTLGANLPNSHAADINAGGEVVGWSYDPANRNVPPKAFVYDGALRDIGDLGGGTATALAIKESSRVVVGYSSTSDYKTHAFLYGFEPTMQDLGGMDNVFRPYTIATDINWFNQVVGYAYGLQEPAHAFLYPNPDFGAKTPMKDLGTLPGYVESYAMGISDSGTVYGHAKAASGAERPFAYYEGVMRDIGTLGGSESRADGINNRGMVFGTSTTAAGREHAFLYYDNRIRDLGALGSSDSWANGINDAGQVVGGSYAAGHPRMHAFVYDSGKMIDLSKLLPAKSGWELINAFDINNRGQIVGIGVHNGKSRAFLLNLGPADKQGPVTSNVSVLPSPAKVAPTVTAKVDDTSTGGSIIVAAEYFIDKQGASGKGTPMNAAFDSATQTVTAVLPAETFNSLKHGKHTVYVHGKDAAGNWGKLVPATFVKDALGPVASSVKVAPSPTNVEPTLTAKIDDTSKGGSILAAAEYFIDAPGSNGSGTPIDVVSGKVAQTVTTVLDSQAFADLSEGSHKVYVHGKDAVGNWGTPVSAAFVKDTLGPASSSVKVSPSPTKTAPTVTATIDDTSNGRSRIAAAEYFIDAPGTFGSGIAMTAADKKFNSPKENVRGVLSSSVFAGLSPGTHTIYVHGKDAAGNWGNLQSTNFAKIASTTAAAVTSPPVAAAKSATRSVSAARANDAAILALLMDSPTKLREREPQSSDILLESFSASMLD